jgi:ADP-ribosylglycohydrolase
MSSLAERRAGLLYGSFVAEALSLGVHWIYDPTLIATQRGRVTDYAAPAPDSYHPGKQAGDQGHVGDQALRLLHFLNRERRWDAPAFLQDWAAMWEGYSDYFDKATKATLANLSAGAGPGECGAASDELAGPARIAPLAAFLATAEESALVNAATEQTSLTHRTPPALEAARFLAHSCHRLLHGADLRETLQMQAPAWAWTAASEVMDLGATDAIGILGRACPVPAALPAVVYLVRKHGDDVDTAFIENAMAGGDNCARGLALGMILGAAHGVEAIPLRWRQGLRAAPALDTFLASLP